MAFDSNSYKAEFAKQNYERVPFDVPKGKRDEIRILAKREGMSVNDLLKSALHKAYGLDLSK